MKRINKYLNSPDIDLSNVTHDKNMNAPVVLKNAVLSWGSPGITATQLLNYHKILNSNQI